MWQKKVHSMHLYSFDMRIKEWDSDLMCLSAAAKS